MTLPADEPRCLGHGAGPGGWQARVECVNCARRLAPRAEPVRFIDPPKEFPCPQKLVEVVDA